MNKRKLINLMELFISNANCTRRRVSRIPRKDYARSFDVDNFTSVCEIDENLVNL